MLTHLWITNIVLVKNLELDFGAGLCVLTGETGAGKSILLDSLGLALGRRASSALIRKGCDYGEISASFQLPTNHHALSHLKQQDLLDPDETAILIRRKIQQDGSSKAWLNGRPITISMLREITSQLVEIHGQFDTQKLLNAAHHRSYLDNYGGYTSLLQQVATAYLQFKQQQQEHQNLLEKLEKQQQEEEFLRHGLNELETLEPQENEEAEILEKRQQIRAYKDVAEILLQAENSLEHEHGILPQISHILRLLERESASVDGQFDPIIELLEQASEAANNALAELQSKQSEMHYDPYELEQLEDRLYALRDAARKFHCSTDALPNILREMQQNVQILDNSEQALKQQTQALSDAKNHYQQLAQKLSEKRIKAAQNLDKALNQELVPLHLHNAFFQTQIIQNSNENSWTSHGYDQIEFCIATQKNATPAPMGKIASGGELARFTLALRIVLAKSDSLRTLILDEADTGISGRIADAMGQRLIKLSQDLQLITITHSPQVAAKGHDHYLVEKLEQNQQTITQVTKLSFEQRLNAIAAMLSGETITAEAKAAAKALLQKP